MRKLLLGIAVLLAYGSSRAADVTINGADKPVLVNSFAELSVKTEKDDRISWTVYPVPVKKVDKGDGSLYFSGPPGTKYTVSVVVVNFEAKTFNTGAATVTMAGRPPPPPDEPDVDPDEPDKPQAATILSKLKVAWKDEVEADKPLLPNLTAVYRAAEEDLTDPADTWGHLFESMAKTTDAQKVAGKLPSLQSAVSVELKKRLPWKGVSDTKMTSADKKKAKLVFGQVADALEKLR